MIYESKNNDLSTLKYDEYKKIISNYAKCLKHAPKEFLKTNESKRNIENFV